MPERLKTRGEFNRAYCREKKINRDRRPGARERGYTAAWERARLRWLSDHPLRVEEVPALLPEVPKPLRWLSDHPLRVECLDRGETTRATVVDHVIPHRGDKAHGASEAGHGGGWKRGPTAERHGSAMVLSPGRRKDA